MEGVSGVKGENGSEGEDVWMGELVEKEGGGANVVAIRVDLDEFGGEEGVGV